MNEHRVEFAEQLDQLRTDVSRLAQMSTEMLGRGTAALLDRDAVAQQAVIDEDEAVDVLAFDLEERCYSLLALQNPMAGDLRLVITTLRLAMEIERCADLAVNICKGAARLQDAELDPRMRGLIETMNTEAVRMLRHAAASFFDSDVGLAAALDELDDRLDQLQVEMVQHIFEAHRLGMVSLDEAVQLALICRYYERVGDHAVNIGQRVIYLVSGALPLHGTAAEPVGPGGVVLQGDTPAMPPSAAESGPTATPETNGTQPPG